jgi:hypothetical protein
MYKVLNTAYKNISKKDIAIAELGNSTKDFAFFIADSASLSLSLSNTANSVETLENHTD